MRIMNLNREPTGPGRHRHRLLRRLAGLVLATAVTAGCAALPSMPKTIYDLSAPDNFRTASGTRAQILVPEPSAPKALDTDMIAGRPNATQYAYLSNAVWSDRLPKLLQARLMETLQNSDRARAVGIPGQGLLIDYQVILDLRAFEIAGDYAQVAFAAKILNDRNGRVVATRTFMAEAVITAPDNPSGVAALDAAMDQAFVSLTQWVLAAI